MTKRFLSLSALRSTSERSAPRLERIAVGLVVAWFVARVVFLATNLHPFVPPDEVDLFGRSVHFASTLGIPEDTAESARFGVVERRPYLYFWIFGRFLALFAEPAQALVWARLANLPFALATLYYTYRMTSLFTASRTARVASVAILSNVLQFTHLSSTVTYDNLFHAASAAMLFHLFACSRSCAPRRTLAFAIAVAIGCLTKITMLPLAGLAVVLYVWNRRRTLGSDLAACWRWGSESWGARAALAVFALFASLNLQLYGGNLVRYGRILPAAEQYLPLEVALNSRIVRRNWIIEQFRSGKLSYEQALAEIERVPNRGNRNRARRTVEAIRAGRLGTASSLPKAIYAVRWLQIARDRLVGFQGNGSYVVQPYWLLRALFLPAAVGLLLCTVVGISRDREVAAGDGLAIVVGYGLLLMWGVSYRAFLASGMIDFTVNGRYLLPLLPIALSLAGRYVLAPLRRLPRSLLATAAVAIFVASDVPYLLDSMTACWFVDAPGTAGCVY